MKRIKPFLLPLALVALGIAGWFFLMPAKKNVPDAKAVGKVYRSVKVRGKESARTRTETKIEVGPNLDRPKKENPAAKPDRKWNPFDVEKKNGFNLALDSDDELEFSAEVTETLKGVLAQLEDAQADFSRKRVLKSVQAILAMIRQNGSASVPAFAKRQAIEALKFCGGGIDVMPEIVELASDEDPAIAEAAIEALQEMLWDFDTKPTELVGALKKLLTLTTDQSIIEPFVFELGDLKPSYRVKAALAIMDSGNEGALQSLSDNMPFVFDDFNGAIQTRADIVNYGQTHPDSSVETLSGN